MKLVDDEVLRHVDVAVDASHEVAGRLSLYAREGQRLYLLVEQRAHHQRELVAGDGGKSRLQHGESAVQQVKRDDRHDDKRELRHLTDLTVSRLVEYVVVERDFLDLRHDELEYDREYRHDEREAHHQPETLRHSEDLSVDLHVVEAVRADIRSAHERSAALRAEALLLTVGYRLGLRGIL